MVTSIQLGNIFSGGGKTILGGSSTGFDTEALINGLVAAKRLPAVKLEDTIKLNDNRTQALTDLKDIFTRFKDAANFLRNPPGVQNSDDNIFAYRTGTVSSNTAVTGGTYLSATVESGTQIQNYTINEITQLAQAKKQETDPFVIANANTQVVFTVPGADQFGAGTITVNGQNITLADGDTLQTVANKFNAVKTQTGINASILQVSPGNFKLIFTATSTGLSADFDLGDPGTVTSDPSGVLTNMSFSETQPALNAEFKIDNVDIERETNNIDDLIDGVTLTLKQTTPALTTLDLSITPDTEIVKAGIINFVDLYNEFKIFATKQTAVNDDGSAKDDAFLIGNTTLRTLVSQVQTELSLTVNGLSVNERSRLADVGITFQDYPGDEENPFTRNIMTVDEAKLSAALAADFEGVRKVFQFDFTSSSSNVQVFSRTNALDVTEFTLNINTGTDTFQATYGATTVNFDFSALPGGGYTLTGPDGSDLEGLVLVYTGPATDTATIELTQGIGDRLFNILSDALTLNTGSLDQELQNIEDKNTRAQQDIDRIDAAIERYREQQLQKFSALESLLASVNTLLQTLDAQSRAQQNN